MGIRHPSRGRPRKRWIDCAKDDMKIKGVSMEMTSIEENGRRNMLCRPHLVGLGDDDDDEGTTPPPYNYNRRWN
jgi:hypothetical protein